MDKEKVKIALIVIISVLVTGAVMGGTIYGVTQNKGIVKLVT